MTTSHAGLARYRAQLHEAIDHDLRRQARGRRRRRRAFALGVPITAAAVTASLLLAGGTPVGSSPADAAILHHVAAVLEAPSNSILHERAMVSIAGAAATRFELWARTGVQQYYRVIKAEHEASVTPNGVASYDAGADTITVGPPPPPRAGGSRDPVDLAASLRAMVGSGQATVVASTTYGGVSAYELSVHGASDPFLNGTAYVAAADYHPLELDSTANGGERIAFSAYEYLPATAANLRLLDVTAVHPGARVIG